MCATCVASCIRIWCGLKPNTGCVGFESTWPEFGYWPMSDILSGPGLPCGTTMLFAVYGLVYWTLGCIREANLCIRVDFFQPGSEGISIKGLRFPEAHLHLLATMLLPYVAMSSFRAFQRKNVDWVQAGLDPQILPRITSSVWWVDLGQEDRASCSLSWRPFGQVL